MMSAGSDKQAAKEMLSKMQSIANEVMNIK